ncbi:MAG TPA: ABC transporter substrate-binding protein [Burkholderiales bacterium]|nr:ABC transporter substrate-binding protein [Burkholderiales bacterium]
MRIALILIAFPAALISGCGEVWNDPYPAQERGQNILYAAFVQRPKHLDPVQSYTVDESVFTRQVMEPPLQYHYLKRPYELVPLTAAQVPEPRLIDGGKRTVYEIRIRPGIRYQPHPAFVEENHALGREAVRRLRSPYELPLGTRELTADDYVYQIKRLAHPRLHSPILGLMSEYIVGLREYAAALRQAEAAPGAWLDLREHPLEGVQPVDRYTYRVTLNGAYPQFVYWLAMPFFSPVPWEVEKFFHQEGMAARNFTLDWWPVGTGPYMLVENDPNRRMVLERNPNFRGEPYPSEGESGDAQAGLLADAGRTMPFIDRLVFTREKESVPYWNKFLQGYYDTAGIGSDQFDQAIRVAIDGAAEPSREMAEKGIALATSVAATTYYFGFNMKDPVVGGGSERARKLRQAISIAVDMEEYLSIFANGRGVVAHSPLPPGLFGRREGAQGVNPVTHEWREGREQRRPLDAARRLLAEAGYPDGRDARSGAPLVLYFDTVSRGPGDKARLDWWRRQLARLGIQLQVRETDWNRFQEKIRKGTQQVYGLGWAADYPDPENFLFLLHGPQARADGAGSNSSNYADAEYDALFDRMKVLPNSPERQALIDRMVDIARRDAPWIFGFHPKDYTLRHGWLANAKPNAMAGSSYKYLRVDPALREARRAEWNAPRVWPAALIAALIGLSAVPAVVSYRRRERLAAKPG